MGDTFGEEALISDAKRNATVTMLTDGALMRLGKDDFNALLNEPMLHWVDYGEAQQHRRGRRTLAGRAPAERVRALPLRRRAQRAALLRPPEAQDAGPGDAATSSVATTGRRSSAAAFILSERGFDAYVLQGRHRRHGTRRGR